MPASVFLPQVFLPRSAVSLGRLVTNVDEPHQYFHDPPCDVAPDIKEKVQTQYDSLNRSDNQRNFASILTNFISATLSKRAKASVRLTTEVVKTYYLNNNGQWFKEAMKLDETRRWIERTHEERDDIYLVVGYHTVLDARVKEQGGRHSNAGGELSLPVSAGLAASGLGGIFVGNWPDPGIEGSRGRMTYEQSQFVAEGEQICAVQYRKVRVRWLARPRHDKIALASGTQWERYDRTRSVQDSAEDIVDVDLKEDCEVGSVCETYLTELGDVFVAPAGLELIN